MPYGERQIVYVGETANLSARMAQHDYSEDNIRHDIDVTRRAGMSVEYRYSACQSKSEAVRMEGQMLDSRFYVWNKKRNRPWKIPRDPTLWQRMIRLVSPSLGEYYQEILLQEHRRRGD